MWTTYWYMVPGVLEKLELLYQCPDMSFGDIAKAIENEFNVKASRNAVIGKCQRLGLSAKYPHARKNTFRTTATKSSRQNAQRARRALENIAAAKDISVKRPAKLPPPRPPRSDPQEIIVGDVFADATRMITMLDLTKETCRWPVGDVPHYCGGSVLNGEPYCAAHCRVAYQPSNDRVRSRPRYR